MKRMKWLSLLLIFALFAASCGSDDPISDAIDSASDAAGDAAEAVEDAMDDDDAMADEDAMADDAMDDEDAMADDAMDDEDAMADDAMAEEDVTLTQGSDLTFHMITHSDDGPFWSVVKRGMDAACAAHGVDCVWMPGNNDPGQMVVDIETAISEGSAGIAASLPSPDQLIGPLQDAVAAGIPVYTLNSGLNDYQTIGATSHIGQSEDVAGQGAGLRFNALGATTVLCGRQEQSNVGLTERCGGLAETFNGTVIDEFVGLDADQTEQINGIKAILEANPEIDGFLGVGPVIAMSGLAAAQDLGRDLTIGGFDMTPELLDAIEAGDIAFTVDQQQYLQGYLPVVLMFLEATNANQAGGGLPVLTGPGFVTPDNASEVKALSAEGTR
jgi:simple sugar transport system substrate-binding protein